MSPVQGLAEASRLTELNGVLDAGQVDPATAGQLFDVTDAVAGSSALRRTLSDPGIEPGAKAALVQNLFGGRVNDQALAVLRRAAELRWPTSSALLDALERQAVSAALVGANNRGGLDEVIDQLFRFNRLSQSDPGLQAALNDRRAPIEARRELVANLLADRTDPVTVQLATRALSAPGRTFAHALDSYLTIAADLRGRSVARVTVARPLDADQEHRMREALSRSAGRPVDLQIDVDPSVVGGARVVIGDQVIDGTVSSKLTDISRSFG